MEVETTSWKLKVTAAAFLAVVTVIWIVQNGGPVQTKFLFTTVTMPQSALLAITLLAGVVAGILLAVSLSGEWKKKDK